MKTIGMIGGMSWESTVPYYRVANETVAARLGGLHSAKIVLVSVDFHDLERHMREGDWGAVGERLADSARSLERAGAGCIVLCTNTMHKVAGAIERAVGLPLLHIVDAAAGEIARHGVRRVGLLGTRFTMEDDFYRGRLRERHGIEAIVPSEADRETVNRVIFDELCRGRVLEGSRAAFRRIMGGLVDAGAQAIVLGCTELAMLVGPDDAAVPVFDTTALHARAAAEWALGEDSPEAQR
ncbi:MAG: aspartate/glutamate racemase family protein [Thermoanaerobaculia bacterium]|nr:aspartate/glutamate racemase family protein [Thermoanaerobaculia bacterium]